MTPGVLVAIITAAAALGAALIAAASATLARLGHRVTELEKTIEELHQDRHMLWLYARQLLDHIYRGKGPPPPDPPDRLFN